jgi:hypothetical protein
VAVVAAVPLAIWSWHLGPTLEWGDDWAGYLLQARALSAFQPAIELAINTAVVDASDIQVGPYAYPWGYPALLALVGTSLGWDWTDLKAVGGLGLIVLAIATQVLASAFMSRRAAWLVAALATTQGPVVSAALQLTSDVPFAALSVASLTAAVRVAPAAGGLEHPWSAAWPAVLGALAFTVRSNGAVLFAAYPVALTLWALGDWRQKWRASMRHGLVFAVVAGGLTALYFAVLPDGSLFHGRLLVFDLATWGQRVRDHAFNLADFFPNDVVSGPMKTAVLLPTIGLVVAGALGGGPTTALLALYVAGHLALLTLFPIDQGTRYYLPLVAPLFVLGAIGAREAWRAAVPRVAPSPAVLHAVGLGACVWAAVVAFFGVAGDVARVEGGTHPRSASTSALVAYLQSSIPADATVAFRKPRALRLLSGRPAVAVTDPQHLDRIDYYVFDDEHREFQIAEAALTADEQYEVVYNGAPYRVFRRRTSR